MATKTRHQPGSFGQNVFAPMLKAPREFWLAGLGTLSYARQESERLFDKLIAEGEKYEARSRQRFEEEVDEVRTRISDLASEIRLPRMLNKALGRADTLVFHLVPEDEQWAVRHEGEDEILGMHRTKAAALEAARDMARAKEPSRIVVHRADGTIQTSYSYGDTD